MPQAITLKAIAMVKAIVTPSFKDNLVREVSSAAEAQKQRILDLAAGDDARDRAVLEQRLAALLSAGPDLEREQHDLIARLAGRVPRQAMEEIAPRLASLVDLDRKRTQAQTLEIGSLFVQGPLEHFVTVGPGDNLYQAVGGSELIVRDGIIQSIANTDPGASPRLAAVEGGAPCD